MTYKLKKQVLVCPSKGRAVEVKFAVSGSWLAPRYDIFDCPAMFDNSQSCDLQCLPLLSGGHSVALGTALTLPGRID